MLSLLNPGWVFRACPSTDPELPGQFMRPYIPFSSRAGENSSGAVTEFRSEAERNAYHNGRMWADPKEEALQSQFTDIVLAIRGRSPLEDLAADAITALTALEERLVYYRVGAESILIAVLLSEGQRVIKVIIQPLDFWHWEKQGRHKEFDDLLKARETVAEAYSAPNARIRIRPKSLVANVVLGEVKPSKMASFLSKLNTQKGRTEFGLVFKLGFHCPPDMSPFVNLKGMPEDVREDFAQAGIVVLREGEWQYTNAFKEALDDF